MIFIYLNYFMCFYCVLKAPLTMIYRTVVDQDVNVASGLDTAALLHVVQG